MPRKPPSNHPRAFTRLQKFLQVSHALHTPPPASTRHLSIHPPQYRPVPGSESTDPSNPLNHAWYVSTTRFHAPPLLAERVLYAPILTCPASVSHTGSEPGIPHAPASYQIPACLSNLYLRHTGTQPAVPPELRHTRSQPSRLTSFKVLLHAPVLNPFSLFQKKKKKKSK